VVETDEPVWGYRGWPMEPSAGIDVSG
jgi:hypothetical protein